VLHAHWCIAVDSSHTPCALHVAHQASSPVTNLTSQQTPSLMLACTRTELGPRTHLPGVTGSQSQVWHVAAAPGWAAPAAQGCAQSQAAGPAACPAAAMTTAARAVSLACLTAGCQRCPPPPAWHTAHWAEAC
jgi:hypothetical protein